jgi:hypothetical protein
MADAGSGDSDSAGPAIQGGREGADCSLIVLTQFTRSRTGALIWILDIQK